MTFNRTQMKTGPGQFKIDPFLIKTGSLDSIIKQTIYEANLFNSERQDLIKIYEDRNAIVVPLLLRIADIEKERKENNDPGQYEDEEDDITKKIDVEDNKLPKLTTLQELNKGHADRVLTDIQNGVVTVVKGVQIQQKKEAKNKLKTIIQKLGALNNALEQTPDEETRNRTLETREEFQSKYQNHFRKEAEKTTMFRHMNIEKPTKWFMNLASDKKQMDSPSNKLEKNKKKYTDTQELLDDVHNFFEDIFKKRERPEGVSIEKFLGDLKDRPEVTNKILTDDEKEMTNKKITAEELQAALDRVSSGKTPGIDGIEREFLQRFWKLLGKTIEDATEIYVEKEKLNSFMD